MLQRLKQDPSWLWNIPVILILRIVFKVDGWSSIGLSISIYYTYVLIRNMGHTIPIIDLITVMAALQWIVGPFIEYHNDITHYKYQMYVDEITYMSYVVPAVIAFRIGTFISRDYHNLEDIGERVKILLNNYPKLPYLLIIIGLFSPYAAGIFPAAFSFVFFLLANLKYIGIIYLLFSEKPNRWIIFFTILGLTATASIATGMFHDLLLWAMLTFTFVAKELKLNLSAKIIVAIIGIFFAITIQSIKKEFREVSMRTHYTGSRTTLFFSMAMDQWSTGGIVTPMSDQDVNMRLNQGWIISSVMNHVPDHEPFAKGKTVLEALEASLLPRILAPNKPIAGGQENFRKYSGQMLGEGTSMGISLAGEGYVNFGKNGGILFMFTWGLLIGWFWKKLQDWSSHYPTLLIWSPILFLQVVKAETELLVVLNHLIKASILVFALLYYFQRFRRIRI